LYGKKGNYSSQGTFDTASTTNTFPGHFATFIDSTGDNDEFFKLTIHTMDNLVEKSSDQNFATGGYIVFAHYTQGGQNFLLVAMVKKKDGITLVNLKPESIQEVDLSKLHQAIKVNNTSYLHALDAKEDDAPYAGAYLSFVSPVSNKGASGYFIKAFGCSDAIPAEIATKGAIDAVNYYFGANNTLSPYKNEANDAVINLFERLLTNEDEEERICTLDILNDVVIAVINANGIEDIADDFISLANGEDFNVPDSFYPNKKVVTAAVRLKLRGLNGAWTLNFEKRIFGDTPSDEIQYVRNDNRPGGSLIIRNLSESLVRELERTLRNDPTN
jgi:nucleoid-associated protein